VGRLEAEKNPLLLADVLAELNRERPRWRLAICGEGGMAAELQARLESLGVADQAELLGYVPFGDELTALYRSSHVLLHVSWTEGLPQVLLESFAAGLPVVGSDVGGIREAVGDAAILVAPGNAQASAQEVGQIADNETDRRRLIEAGLDYAAEHTVEIETARVARFLETGGAQDRSF
jgi:glycosyltransferase involved in cell wall biosynthesis